MRETESFAGPNPYAVPAAKASETWPVEQSRVEKRFHARRFHAPSIRPAMIPIPYALDAVNFIAADVRNLFGPFDNMLLVTRLARSDEGIMIEAAAGK